MAATGGLARQGHSTRRTGAAGRSGAGSPAVGGPARLVRGDKGHRLYSGMPRRRRLSDTGPPGVWRDRQPGAAGKAGQVEWPGQALLFGLIGCGIARTGLASAGGAVTH
ncbi:hypothetical protein Vqi01_12910 [Micromonospora qiuiae]|uniref:Uncharacterized protein n=1 Tax=Micromonospora qiuiae TaxID=502268 RepID=A0ABQ4J7H1_9ACTN|nr:hypothetical protein Vqi01_12910 [Micromonospora qiuiae]